jgi:glucose/arabinose dehydrogenase
MTAHPLLRPLAAAFVALALLTVGLTGCGGDDDDGDRSGSSSGSESDGLDPAVGGADDPGAGDLGQVAVELTEVAQLDRPTVLTARAGTTDLYVGERAGQVRVLSVAADGSVEAAGDPLLDISDDVSLDGEQGLLGLAFSADGATMYVSYTNEDGDSRLVQYAMDGDEVDTGSRRELLAVDQPYSNHNGGDVKVGPDGLVYFGLGDGGAADDPDDRAQDTDDLLGKILRIDPSGGTDDEPYAIPDTNPYRDGGGKPEIFLTGVRNPWRFSFDPDGGDLWIGDVGQNEIEEVDVLALDDAAGANLGWSGYEGSEVFIEDRVQDGAVPPVFEYTHSDGGCSITGGEVYRGERTPALAGAYVFGDYCDGTIRLVTVDDDHRLTASAETDLLVPSLVSINPDNEGELYLLSLDGPVYRLDPTG